MTEYSLWGNTGGSSTPDNSTPVVLGTKIKATSAVSAVGIRYYRGTASPGTKTGRIFRTSDSSVVSEIVTFTDSGLGWQEARFVTPVALEVGTLHTVAVLFPSGQPSYTSGYWTAPITSGPLYAPSNAEAPGQGVFTADTVLNCPTNTFGSNGYWVDIIVADSSNPPITLNGIPSTLAIGQPSLTPGPVTISPTGIASTAAVGVPALTPGAASISLAGIPSSAATGQPTLAPGPATISLTGIASATAMGTPTLTPGPATIQLAGIASTTTVGQPRLSEPGIEIRRFSAGPPYTRGRAYPPRT